ncbi:MAG: tyrosine-type recombinase/integrase [Armatimonadota bacterium]|nr:tyrosine-type recombinase/integrase [Armatimonadota bacterium]
MVGGSIPSGPAKPVRTRVSAVRPLAESAEKAPAHPLREALEAFLLTKQVAGCTSATVKTYRWWLERFFAAVPEANPSTVRAFFARLQEQGLSASRQHQAYRTFKTFCRWCVETGALPENPLRGFTMRTPKTLPDVPAEEDLRAILAACPETLEGIRIRALVLVPADAGLRAGEVLRLLVEDWRASDPGLFVRAGKGRKDRVTFIGPTTTRALKAWLARHPLPSPEAFLFCDRAGRPLKYRHLVQIMHRLSQKAGLPDHRRLHPHALRHFAATAWLRNGAGLDEVRRLLGHESLNTTLRYSSLVGADLQRAHRKTGAIERLRLE